MKKFKLLSLTLALLIVLTSFAGCGNGEQTKEDKPASSESQTTNDKKEDAQEAKPVVKDFSAGLTTEKIGSTEHSVQWAYSKPANSGVCYKTDDGKYGIMSFDGKTDTGAKYSYAQPLDKYFLVTTKTTATSIEDMNSVGLVDINGKEILPMEYVGISQLNERYYQLYVATGTTTNKDDALIYSGSGMVYPGEDDALYTGKWYIYDIIEGKKVEGATGTKAYAHSAKGDILQYHLDDKTTVIVNHKGDSLPYSISMGNGIKIFDNGYYTNTTNDKVELFNSEGKKMFECDPKKDFVPSNSLGDYFYATKYDGKVKYVVMDKNGKVISKEFEEFPSLRGDYIFVEKKLCKMDGTPVVEGTFDSVKFDTLFKNTYFLYSGSNLTCIDKEGNVIYEGINRETSYFAIKDDLKQYYCFKDKDFTINSNLAYARASWIIEVQNKDNTAKKDLVDSISGETLVSGYNSFIFITNEDNSLYVYAKGDEAIDIYIVK